MDDQHAGYVKMEPLETYYQFAHMISIGMMGMPPGFGTYLEGMGMVKEEGGAEGISIVKKEEI